MNLQTQIILIDALIRENRDATIADYISVTVEIQNIQKSIAMPHPGIGQEKREEILKLAATMTAAQIKAETNVSFCTIYRVLKNEGYDVKSETKKRRAKASVHKQEQERKEREGVIQGRQPIVPLVAKGKKPFERPPAEYSNRSPMGIATEFNNQKAAI